MVLILETTYIDPADRVWYLARKNKSRMEKKIMPVEIDEISVKLIISKIKELLGVGWGHTA